MKLTRKAVEDFLNRVPSSPVTDSITGMSQYVSGQDVLEYIRNMDARMIVLAEAVADKITGNKT